MDSFKIWLPFIIIFVLGIISIIVHQNIKAWRRNKLEKNKVSGSNIQTHPAFDHLPYNVHHEDKFSGPSHSETFGSRSDEDNNRYK